jgi:hypothetical protein
VFSANGGWMSERERESEKALSRVLHDKIYAKPNNKQNGCFLWCGDSVRI